jgi:tripartite-type tricarboxylate transporter receptor subunit TctC
VTKSRALTGVIAGACSAWLVAGTAYAQTEAYPTRPITMVVPFPPGGFADVTGRPLAIPLGRELGQTVVIENKGGAGGAVGNAYVARAKPDGYTILMALNSVTVIPEAERFANRPVPYAMSQFAPVALIAAEANVFLVRPEARWASMTDLLAEAKQKPGVISYSSSGVNGVIHLGVEILAHAAGVKFLHAPYQGGGPSMNALLAGEVDFTSQAPSVGLPQVQGGKARALATSGAERIAAFPDAPTLKELGLDAEYKPWAAIFAPVGTPEPVLERLRAAIRKAVADDGFKKAMATLGTPITHRDGAAFEQFVAAETQRNGEVVRRIGKLE